MRIRGWGMLVMALGAVTPAGASELKGFANVWADYGIPSFGAVNDANRDAVDAAKRAGSGDANGVKVSSLFGGGLTAGVAIGDRARAGFRTGYLVSNQGALKYTTHEAAFSPLLVLDTDRDDTARYSAVPLLVGGEVRTPVNEKAWVGIALYVGLGLTGAREVFDGSTTSSGILGTGFSRNRGTLEASGSGTMAEVSVGGSMRLGQSLSLGLDLGYRLLKTHLAADGDVDLDGDGAPDIHKGDVATDADGRKMDYDFSGLFANLSLCFHM